MSVHNFFSLSIYNKSLIVMGLMWSGFWNPHTWMTKTGPHEQSMNKDSVYLLRPINETELSSLFLNLILIIYRCGE